MRLLLALAMVGLTLSGSPAADDPKNKMKVEISKGKVTIDGKELAIPADLTTFEKAFGKASGSVIDPVSDTNKYVYWKDLGIRCSQSTKGKMQIQEVEFNLEPSYDLSAKARAKPFIGEILVEGAVIGKASSKDDVKKIKSGSDSFGSWKIDYSEPPLQVMIHPSEKGTKAVTVQVPLSAR
jgi:hypothetical protein